MIDAQGQIDHLHDFGNDFGTAAEARENMADVAVVRLDGEGQVCAGEELVFGDETVKAFPVVGEEGLTFEADFIEELLTEPAPAKALGSVQIAEFSSFCHDLQDFEAMFEGDGPRRLC
jgi:hypothetical protein